MARCMLMGIEDNRYTRKDTGELVESSILHVAYEKPARAEQGLKGARVESIKVMFDVSDLQIGFKYDLVYEARRFGNKSYAQLVDIIPVKQ